MSHINNAIDKLVDQRKFIKTVITERNNELQLAIHMLIIAGEKRYENDLLQDPMPEKIASQLVCAQANYNYAYASRQAWIERIARIEQQITELMIAV